jgi:hypothetical protein
LEEGASPFTDSTDSQAGLAPSSNLFCFLSREITVHPAMNSNVNARQTLVWRGLAMNDFLLSDRIGIFVGVSAPHSPDAFSEQGDGGNNDEGDQRHQQTVFHKRLSVLVPQKMSE